MKFRKCTKAQLEQAVWIANSLYNGNLRVEWGREGNTWFNAVLRVHDSYRKGARRAYSGRHTIAASWDAHRDVMRALFSVNPDAVIITALVRYNGFKDFEDKYLETRQHQVGSMMQPASLGELSVTEDEPRKRRHG